jgi:uncharacterized membrane protein
MDEDSLPWGQTWQPRVEEALRTMHSAAVLLGPAGLGDWQAHEARICLTQSIKRGVPLIPVLLPGGPSPEDLPFFLIERTCADLRDDISGERLCRLVREIQLASGIQTTNSSTDHSRSESEISEPPQASSNDQPPPKDADFSVQPINGYVISPKRSSPLMLVLSYLGILSLIPFLYRKNDIEVQWHARNGMALFVTETFLSLLIGVISHLVPFMGCVLGMSWLVLPVLHIVLIIRALMGRRLNIPGIRRFAESNRLILWSGVSMAALVLISVIAALEGARVTPP